MNPVNNAAITTASVDTFGDGWEPHMAVKYAPTAAFRHRNLANSRLATSVTSFSPMAFFLY